MLLKIVIDLLKIDASRIIIPNKINNLKIQKGHTESIIDWLFSLQYLYKIYVYTKHNLIKRKTMAYEMNKFHQIQSNYNAPILLIVYQFLLLYPNFDLEQTFEMSLFLKSFHPQYFQSFFIYFIILVPSCSSPIASARVIMTSRTPWRMASKAFSSLGIIPPCTTPSAR